MSNQSLLRSGNQVEEDFMSLVVLGYRRFSHKSFEELTEIIPLLPRMNQEVGYIVFLLL